jgi:hypothetical protein
MAQVRRDKKTKPIIIFSPKAGLEVRRKNRLKGLGLIKMTQRTVWSPLGFTKSLIPVRIRHYRIIAFQRGSKYEMLKRGGFNV